MKDKYKWRRCPECGRAMKILGKDFGYGHRRYVVECRNRKCSEYHKGAWADMPGVANPWV